VCFWRYDIKIWKICKDISAWLCNIRIFLIFGTLEKNDQINDFIIKKITETVDNNKKIITFADRNHPLPQETAKKQ